MSVRFLGVAVVTACALAAAASADLARTPDSALRGTTGLEVTYTGARQKNFLSRQLPGDHERIVASFYIRPVAGFTFEGGGRSDVLTLRSGSRTIVRGYLKKRGSGFQLRFKVRDAGRLRKLKKKVKLRLDDEAEVAIEWQAASSADAEDGLLRVRFNEDNVFDSKTGLDNGDETIDNFRFGQVSKPPAGWTGRIDYDNVLVRNRP